MHGADEFRSAAVQEAVAYLGGFFGGGAKLPPEGILIALVLVLERGQRLPGFCLLRCLQVQVYVPARACSP